MDEELYKQHILDLYRNPHNKGELDDYDMKAQGSNPSCGDELILYLALTHTGKVERVGYTGDGCAISQAATSMLTDKIIGMSVREMEVLSEDDIYAMLGITISPGREKCALLALHTLKSGLHHINK